MRAGTDSSSTNNTPHSSRLSRHPSLLILGGGIVGLATGYEYTRRFPDREIAILEKESHVAEHQTGRNSGVLHSGIYYRPGSLKALNCRAGKKLMEEFCREHAVPFETCGKVITAVHERELPALETILQRGKANGVNCEFIGPERLRELEPEAAGIAAIYVPEAGIVDYRRVAETMRAEIERGGSRVHLGAKVTAIRREADQIHVATTSGEWSAPFVVNCTGLHSDRIARLGGEKPEAKIVPFRGEYYELKPEAHRLCRNLIYPVPDPNFPFLGVHFTRMISGGVECGPNAVLAFAREGYRKTDVNLRDLFESLTYGGFLRMAWRYWPMGLGEMYRSFSKQAFVAALSRLVPAITANDLIPHRAGIRAQAVARNGSLVDDFVIQSSNRIVNVLNAPSPAATSSLNIARTILGELQRCEGLRVIVHTPTRSSI